MLFDEHYGISQQSCQILTLSIVCCFVWFFDGGQACCGWLGICILNDLNQGSAR